MWLYVYAIPSHVTMYVPRARAWASCSAALLSHDMTVPRVHNARGEESLEYRNAMIREIFVGQIFRQAQLSLYYTILQEFSPMR